MHMAVERAGWPEPAPREYSNVQDEHENGAIQVGLLTPPVVGRAFEVWRRRLQAAMRSSRLPAIKRLTEFDFSFELLGHANIKTTDTYLNATRLGLRESMRKYEEFQESC